MKDVNTGSLFIATIGYSLFAYAIMEVMGSVWLYAGLVALWCVILHFWFKDNDDEGINNNTV